MSSTADAAAAKSTPPAPVPPFGWYWMQAALIISGLVGFGAGMWQSTWWQTGESVPSSSAPPIVHKGQELTSYFSGKLKLTNLAQLTLSAALVMGGTLMGARFAALRLGMLAISWLGILYAVIGSSIYVWYLVNWASWADQMQAIYGDGYYSGTSAWILAILLGLLGLGKLLFFIVAVGYFGRFDVRAYLEDLPSWFVTSSVAASAKA